MQTKKMRVLAFLVPLALFVFFFAFAGADFSRSYQRLHHRSFGRDRTRRKVTATETHIFATSNRRGRVLV